MGKNGFKPNFDGQGSYSVELCYFNMGARICTLCTFSDMKDVPVSTDRSIMDSRSGNEITVTQIRLGIAMYSLGWVLGKYCCFA